MFIQSRAIEESNQTSFATLVERFGLKHFAINQPTIETWRETDQQDKANPMLRDFAHDKAGVVSSKSEAVRQNSIESNRPSLIGNKVQIALRILIFEVDCRRNKLVHE